VELGKLKLKRVDERLKVETKHKVSKHAECSWLDIKQ
jgi:hypothetical protein